MAKDVIDTFPACLDYLTCVILAVMSGTCDLLRLYRLKVRMLHTKGMRA